MTTGDIRARAAKHETRQHTLGGMSRVGKPAQAFQIAQICAHHYWIGIRLMSALRRLSARYERTFVAHSALHVPQISWRTIVAHLPTEDTTAWLHLCENFLYGLYGLYGFKAASPGRSRG